MLPLIDIVFLLLVFFIYAMLSMAVHHGMDMKLPDSSQIKQSEESPLSLSIGKNGDEVAYYVNKEQVTQPELHNLLREYATREDRLVLVFADKDITYQQLFLALDEIKACGISEISLQASQK